MNSSTQYKFKCYCSQCSEGRIGKYQLVARWTLARHKKKEAAKDESEKVQEIDANNEMIVANKSDSDDDSAEDVSNWEVMENDEVNVSDSMDIVEFDTVATKTVRTKRIFSFLNLL
ncbi:hypothetical protein RO3G_05339 [Rhizopus delemar RA 99-880]|uniref:Uncharacterized protein n=1 Tax=Rhizopus delemar (strain RA 99-880 / ATCC MYA-4621 / FGSC 9543 / NRRL 43880) TaxID=246409 RepID=I1BWQ4_RHIO9|nr:hypothetical protein RO3G_05339 [Rhizopus delemar RA 99-880]|eukprot:EIE80634.1 hypothetical protein RO3G_05339 [Rhizopus delemar RA 99-880]